jgi:CPA1 family monovalent cation:H+ antiporter
VGVVVFLAVLGFAGAGHGQDADGPGQITLLFLRETLGGAVLGGGLGFLAYRMLKSVDKYQVEVLISVALVSGGYALADALHVSGPIAMVVAGLLIGNHGRALAMSDETRANLDTFWELIDDILNAVLFVLIGLEVLLLSLRREYLIAGAVAIGVVLAARWVAVALPVMVLRPFADFRPHAIKMLTWGGLRGGISVALALSLVDLLGHEDRAITDIILVMTYVVVAFSIIVQGLSIGPLSRRWLATAGVSSQQNISVP